MKKLIPLIMAAAAACRSADTYLLPSPENPPQIAVPEEPIVHLPETGCAAVYLHSTDCYLPLKKTADGVFLDRPNDHGRVIVTELEDVAIGEYVLLSGIGSDGKNYGDLVKLKGLYDQIQFTSGCFNGLYGVYPHPETVDGYEEGVIAVEGNLFNLRADRTENSVIVDLDKNGEYKDPANLRFVDHNSQEKSFGEIFTDDCEE
ncbi:MAG: hypothetical protein Q8R37_05455 [Nanoarchaeota archaeon]|nr:hypothetical protein [Nanoarchaeota archaeon]